MKFNLWAVTPVFFVSLTALAAPKLSDEIQQILASATKYEDTSAQKHRVLIQYKIETPDQNSFQSLAYKIQAQKNLIQTVKRFESEILFDISESENWVQAETLWIARGTALTLSTQTIQKLAKKHNLSHISLLGRKASLVVKNSENFGLAPATKFTYGLQKIKLPELKKIYPELTGAAVKVGIIDTGIDSRHPDLIGKTQLFKDFTNPRNTSPIDDHGHGSHVAGTIGGGDASGKLIGVASEVKLVIAKSFTRSGSSKDEDLIKSLQWMADPDANPETQDQVQIVSNSWNMDESNFKDMNPADEPFCVVVDSLINLGIAPVFAAGNDGTAASSIKLPAACPNALSVGATDDRDRLADFSSRGPVKWKSGSFIKPEVSAPGKSIESAEPGGGLRTRSGTSMAAPHVAGALALMYQLNPQINFAQAQKFLFKSAADLGVSGQDNLYGFGRIDVLQTIHNMKQQDSFLQIGKIIGDNDLIPVNAEADNIPEQFQHLAEAIGWTNYGCTVTHIGRGYALSAGHCFDATAILEFDKSCSFAKVDWGYREGKNPTLKSECEKIVARQNDAKGIDFALLKMKSYPKAIAELKKNDHVYPNQQITILSHPEGMPLRWSQMCFVSSEHFHKVPEGLLEYTCDTMGGSSGAVLIDAQSAAVVGIHKGGFVETNYGSHLLTGPLMDILYKLGF